MNDSVESGYETEHASYYNLELADDDWNDF